MRRRVLRSLGVTGIILIGALLQIGATSRGPARIGVVLPGVEWQRGLDGLREGDTAAAIRVRFSEEALNRADDLVGGRAGR